MSAWKFTLYYTWRKRPLGKGIDVYHSILFLYITSLVSLVPLTLYLLSSHPNSLLLCYKTQYCLLWFNCKLFTQAHMFELLVPSQWGCFGRLWNHQGVESSWRNVLLGVTLEVSEPTLHPHCLLTAYTMCPTNSASCCWNFTTIADVSSPTVSPSKLPLPWLLLLWRFSVGNKEGNNTRELTPRSLVAAEVSLTVWF